MSNRSILGFVYWDGPYYGRIVDEKTGVPIEGAAVAGIWNFEHLYLISIQNVANIKETITDKNGKFKLPLTFAFTLYPFSILEEMNLLVFKPGYDSHPTAIKRRTKPEWADYTARNGLYWVGRRANCKAQQVCLVKLNKTRTLKERQDAYAKIFSEYPDIYSRLNKNKVIVKMVLNESKDVQELMSQTRNVKHSAEAKSRIKGTQINNSIIQKNKSGIGKSGAILRHTQ